jgi:hypothetical protein
MLKVLFIFLSPCEPSALDFSRGEQCGITKPISLVYILIYLLILLSHEPVT